jgi:hypothetical protein
MRRLTRRHDMGGPLPTLGIYHGVELGPYVGRGHDDLGRVQGARYFPKSVPSRCDATCIRPILALSPLT